MALNGGKHYLAVRIVALMPHHIHYCEPYFGGGAVLLAKDPRGTSEAVNDLHGGLTQFWQALACPAAFEQLLRLLQAVPFAEPLWEQARVRLATPCQAPPGSVCVTCGAAFFVVCRQSLAGRMKAFAPLSRTRTRRGMNEQAAAWLSAVEGLPAVHERMKRVAVLGPRDGEAVIRQQDGPDTLFYLDPPYLQETRAAPDVYAHELSPAGHQALLRLVREVKGKVMLSGYQNDLYDSELAGWNRHDFDLANHAAGGEAKRRMTESLWCNF